MNKTRLIQIRMILIGCAGLVVLAGLLFAWSLICNEKRSNSGKSDRPFYIGRLLNTLVSETFSIEEQRKALSELADIRASEGCYRIGDVIMRNSLLRNDAIRCLMKIGDQRSRDVLYALAVEFPIKSFPEVVYALADLEDKRASQLVENMLVDGATDAAILKALGNARASNKPEILQMLNQLLDNKDIGLDERIWAAYASVRLAHRKEEAIRILVSCVQKSDMCREMAIEALSRLGTDGAGGVLYDLWEIALSDIETSSGGKPKKVVRLAEIYFDEMYQMDGLAMMGLLVKYSDLNPNTKFMAEQLSSAASAPGIDMWTRQCILAKLAIVDPITYINTMTILENDAGK